MIAAIKLWLQGVTQLATLEIRYSLRSVTTAIITALILSAVLFSSWALLLAALAIVLVEAGWAWVWALLVVSCVNLVLALLLWVAMKSLVERVGLDATRNALGLGIEGMRSHEEHSHTHTGGGTNNE
jgi:membrane protein implicated in regulation of membrane protease activity